MERTFKQAFKGKRSTLLEKIHLNCDLWAQLVDREVLTGQQISDCKIQATDGDKVSRLLEILEKRDDSLFETFCEALIATDQRHVVNLLRSQTVVAKTYGAADAIEQQVIPEVEINICKKINGAAMILRGHLHGLSEISDLVARLRCDDLSQQATDEHLQRIKERMDDVLRQGMLHLEGNEQKLMVDLFMRLVPNGVEVYHTQPTESIALYMLCNGVRAFEFLRKLTESGELDKLLEDLVNGITHGSPRLTIRTEVEWNDFGATVVSPLKEYAQFTTTSDLSLLTSTECLETTGENTTATQLAKDAESLSPVLGPIEGVDFRTLTDLEKICDGSFGVVYRARHSRYGLIAYKEFGTAVAQPGSKLAKEMKHEVIANSLHHKNIIATLGMVFQRGHHGILLEYAEYGNLDHFIGTVDRQMRVGWFTLFSFARDVACGMAHLHSLTPTPVVHGDIRVHSVLVAKCFVAKIGSFGFSKWKQFSTEYSPPTSLHLPSITNVPPEQFQNLFWGDINLSRTPMYDVYGFAILLWQMFSRSEPFEQYAGQRYPIHFAVLGRQRPHIDAIRGREHPLMPKRMFELAKRNIEQCWEMNPNERPEMKDVHEEFDKFLNEHVDDVKREMEQLQLAVAAAAAEAAAAARVSVGDSSKA